MVDTNGAVLRLSTCELAGMTVPRENGKELAAECCDMLLTLSETLACDGVEVFVALSINDHEVPSA